MSDVPSGMKRCSTCKQWLTVDRFSKNRAQRDGINNACKDCARQRQLEVKNREKPPLTGTSKRCTNCGEEKPYEDFAHNATSYDGFSYHCRACNRSYRQRNLERLNSKKRQQRAEYAKREVIVTPEFKRCPRCNEVKKAVMFNTDKHCRNGLRSKCRSCESVIRHENYERWRPYFLAWAKMNKDRINAKTRERRARNPEYYRRKEQEFRDANIEKIRQKQRAYRAINPQKWRDWKRAWRAANPDKVALENHTRKALIMQNGGFFTLSDLSHIRAIQQGHCAFCNETGKPMTLEHIIPVSRGGTNGPENLCFTCPACNYSRQNKLLEEWTDRWYLRKR